MGFVPELIAAPLVPDGYDPLRYLTERATSKAQEAAQANAFAVAGGADTGAAMEEAAGGLADYMQAEGPNGANMLGGNLGPGAGAGGQAGDGAQNGGFGGNLGPGVQGAGVPGAGVQGGGQPLEVVEKQTRIPSKPEGPVDDPYTEEYPFFPTLHKPVAHARKAPQLAKSEETARTTSCAPGTGWKPGPTIRVRLPPDNAEVPLNTKAEAEAEAPLPENEGALLITMEDFLSGPLLVSKLKHVLNKYGMVKLEMPSPWQPRALSALAEYAPLRAGREVSVPPNLTEPVATELDEMNVGFTRALVRFHAMVIAADRRITKLPEYDRRPVDLFRLYCAVARRGGHATVTRCKEWAQVGRDLGYSSIAGQTLSSNIRLAYTRVILPFVEWVNEQMPDLANAANKGPTKPPNKATKPVVKAEAKPEAKPEAKSEAKAEGEAEAPESSETAEDTVMPVTGSDVLFDGRVLPRIDVADYRTSNIRQHWRRLPFDICIEVPEPTPPHVPKFEAAEPPLTQPSFTFLRQFERLEERASRPAPDVGALEEEYFQLPAFFETGRIEMDLRGEGDTPSEFTGGAESAAAASSQVATTASTNVSASVSASASANPSASVSASASPAPNASANAGASPGPTAGRVSCEYDVWDYTRLAFRNNPERRVDASLPRLSAGSQFATFARSGENTNAGSYLIIVPVKGAGRTLYAPGKHVFLDQQAGEVVIVAPYVEYSGWCHGFSACVSSEYFAPKDVGRETMKRAYEVALSKRPAPIDAGAFLEFPFGGGSVALAMLQHASTVRAFRTDQSFEAIQTAWRELKEAILTGDLKEVDQRLPQLRGICQQFPQIKLGVEAIYSVEQWCNDALAVVNTNALQLELQQLVAAGNQTDSLQTSDAAFAYRFKLRALTTSAEKMGLSEDLRLLKALRLRLARAQSGMDTLRALLYGPVSLSPAAIMLALQQSEEWQPLTGKDADERSVLIQKFQTLVYHLPVIRRMYSTPIKLRPRLADVALLRQAEIPQVMQACDELQQWLVMASTIDYVAIAHMIQLITQNLPPPPPQGLPPMGRISIGALAHVFGRLHALKIVCDDVERILPLFEAALQLAHTLSMETLVLYGFGP